jgi:hypothetical protein
MGMTPVLLAEFEIFPPVLVRFLKPQHLIMGIEGFIGNGGLHHRF